MSRKTINRVRQWAWRTGDYETPGIGLFYDRRLVAHLTPDEALDLANNIVDTLEGSNQ